MATPLRIAPARAGRSAVERARRLAERQFGAIARWQLRDLGFSPSRIEHWLKTGRLHAVYPGVYALGRRGLGTEGKLAAALLFAGRGAALGGLTALWWTGLLGRAPNAIHIDAPGRRTPRPGLSIRHPQEFTAWWRGGLPVAPLPQAILAAAGSLSEDSLRLVLARAEFRGLLDLRSLGSELGPGRAGSRAVRAALAAHLPQLAACTSQLEIDFVLLCEAYAVPMPEPNARVGRFRPDMLWRSHGLVVELDGYDAHHTSAQLAADANREAALRAQGLTVIRFTWDDVHLRPEIVVAELRAHLG